MRGRYGPWCLQKLAVEQPTPHAHAHCFQYVNNTNVWWELKNQSSGQCLASLPCGQCLATEMAPKAQDTPACVSCVALPASSTRRGRLLIKYLRFGGRGARQPMPWINTTSPIVCYGAVALRCPWSYGAKVHSNLALHQETQTKSTLLLYTVERRQMLPCLTKAQTQHQQRSQEAPTVACVLVAI